jgi:hypothetical protein
VKQALPPIESKVRWARSTAESTALVTSQLSLHHKQQPEAHAAGRRNTQTRVTTHLHTTTVSTPSVPDLATAFVTQHSNPQTSNPPPPKHTHAPPPPSTCVVLLECCLELGLQSRCLGQWVRRTLTSLKQLLGSSHCGLQLAFPAGCGGVFLGGGAALCPLMMQETGICPLIASAHGCSCM